MEQIYSVAGYTLESVIGEGTYAMVFLAQEAKTGEKCAIKIIHKGKRGLRGTKHAQKEVAGLKRLSGLSGVVALKEWREDAQTVYLVLSFHQGVSLSSFPLVSNTCQVLHLSRSLLRIIRAMHRRGVYHLDIKPANVLICETGPCLMDFGCCFVADEPLIESRALPFDGTPAYMAPEMVGRRQHAEINLAALDVWSFGCLLYYIATGREAFTASSLYALYPKIRDCEVDYTGVPEEIETVCRRVLVPVPARRITLPQLIELFDQLLR